MEIVSSDHRRPGIADAQVAAVLAEVRADDLRGVVERLSVPRPYGSPANREICAWLEQQLGGLGYAVTRQGAWDNLIATRPGAEAPKILVGAHYDSVAGTPGADDNASGVAALLGCAAVLSRHPPRPVAFALFNREEDDLLGSRDFVEHFLPASGFALREAHVLEMVGFCAHAEGSQRYPAGLPLRGPTRGDFLGLVANRDSNDIVTPLVDAARTCLPDLPIIGLKVHLGIENGAPVLLRSDHAPFWRRRLPALMWTDTSEFRNPGYHLPGDTPDTLDYDFLAKVTRMLVLRCLLS
jgi:hypothetical protein